MALQQCAVREESFIFQPARIKNYEPENEHNISFNLLKKIYPGCLRAAGADLPPPPRPAPHIEPPRSSDYITNP